MSRSTFLTTSSSSLDANEMPSHPTTTNANTDRTNTLRFHHRLMPTIATNSRSNETLPVIVVQSSATLADSLTTTTTTTTNNTQHKSVVRLNPKLKRNLRGTRRSTGIRPDDVSLANATNDTAFNDDDEEEDKSNTCNQFITITSNEPSESFDHNRTSPPKPVFTVSRVQPTFDENSRHSFEKLSINRTDPFVMTSSPSPSSPSNIFSNTSTVMFRPEEFILRRQPSDEDPSIIKRRQLEERICTLESLVRDKDSIILDLQRQLDKTTRDLNDAEQQIYVLQRDKLTLIKTLTTLQDTKSSSVAGGGGGGAAAAPGRDTSTSPKRTGFITRN
ncbi:unnamed protein product [Rotaria sp. Silwood2]|nr:unnamed protein product [Rotaria sp. Silwood2]CAF2939419.1 unnamed protein product [Rotaria sp. Silwood2]CAF3236058.1 unnamed protein product [Rotaria sp. Silwood2]CAF3355891.1 unnamed protein product [Rotaria sp. Silwood2]CAF4026463.1 unnamed protein product [Rotaria sp. Silwood2]